MKQFILIGISTLLCSSCSHYLQDLPISSCALPASSKSTFSKAGDLQQALNEIVSKGVPGIAMAVYSEEGTWSTAAGYSKLESKTQMQVCHLQYLQSISKTYMAVAVLKLFEEGKINLDEPMTFYLPAHLSKYITDAGKITVRMLLNHTSGIPEYNLQPAYVGYLLQHPNHYFAPEDYLRYIDRKPLSFTPGSKYSYRNTNYLILSMIVDAITGDHARYIGQKIFVSLGLTHTYYRGMPGYLQYPELVNTYWDRHSDGILENVSQLQRNNVISLVGDDGIVTTPEEAVLFLKGLLEGKLLAPATVDLMKTWVADSKGNPTYGLGLDYTLHDGHPAIGHSGGGIGAGCQLYYLPEKKLYFFVAINLGTVTDSPIHEAVTKSIDRIYEILLH
jgi:D-alanyl-D-alanine carboxypeptidase